MPDRFFEHPATVLVLTNLYYKEAPWLTPSSDAAASSLVWHEVGLSGTTSRDFEEQITALQPFLAANWRTAVNKATGNPTYVHPTVLVIYREDQKFQLTPVIPRRTAPRADYDLVIASQPYRLRAPLEFKASKVIAPLAKSLAPGGRLIGVHSHGGDPGQEIIRGMWPGENPFIHDRKQMLKATKDALGKEADGLEFNEQPDERALFRYAMHTLPSEVDETIGTSTAFAAWNAPERSNSRLDWYGPVGRVTSPPISSTVSTPALPRRPASRCRASVALPSLRAATWGTGVMPERRRDSAATIIASQVVFGNHGTKVSSSTGSATTNSIVRRTSLDETSIETFMASLRTGYSKRAASMLGSAMGFVADSVNRGAA